MCGILGYIGKRAATSLILEGLRPLEYRGYDSAGIAVLDDAGHQFKSATDTEVLAHLIGEQYDKLRNIASDEHLLVRAVSAALREVIGTYGIGVASTKAFTSQITVLTLLALYLGRIRNLPVQRGLKIIRALEAIPQQVEQILAQDDHIKQIALGYAKSEDFFFLGRQYNFPVALEGAFKLKEISYIHAAGYPSAEMKHGPIALVDEKTPIVIVAPSDALYDKTWSNLREMKARHAPVIALATEGNMEISQQADAVIHLPSTLDPLFPLLGVIPLQLLAYHIAVARGCDVDKPRNLAKSVTVE